MCENFINNKQLDSYQKECLFPGNGGEGVSVI